MAMARLCSNALAFTWEGVGQGSRGAAPVAVLVTFVAKRNLRRDCLCGPLQVSLSHTHTHTQPAWSLNSKPCHAACTAGSAHHSTACAAAHLSGGNGHAALDRFGLARANGNGGAALLGHSLNLQGSSQWGGRQRFGLVNHLHFASACRLSGHSQVMASGRVEELHTEDAKHAPSPGRAWQCDVR